MKKYVPEKLVAISRYQKSFPTPPSEIQKDVYERISELINGLSSGFESFGWIVMFLGGRKAIRNEVWAV